MVSSSRWLGIFIAFVALNGLFNNQTRLYLPFKFMFGQNNVILAEYQMILCYQGKKENFKFVFIFVWVYLLYLCLIL